MRVMIHDPITGQNVGSYHGGKLLGRIPSVRAGAVYDCEVLLRNVLQICKQPAKQPVRRKRPGDIRNNDRDSVSRGNSLPERNRVDRLADGLLERRCLIR